MLTNQHKDDLEGYLTKDNFHHSSSDTSPILKELSAKLVEQVMPRLCKRLMTSKALARA